MKVIAIIAIYVVAALIAIYNLRGGYQGIQVAGASFLFLMCTPLLFVKLRAVKYLRWILFGAVFAYGVYVFLAGYPATPDPSRFSL